MGRSLSIDVEQIGRTTSRASARSHELLVDRPREKDGEDRGPLGGELLLVALAGCFMSTLLAAINTRSADVSNARVSATGTIGGVPERFESIELSVTATYQDDELIRKLVGIAERGCLVTNTLKDAVRLSVAIEKSSS
jgi:putative redox protein